MVMVSEIVAVELAVAVASEDVDEDGEMKDDVAEWGDEDVDVDEVVEADGTEGRDGRTRKRATAAEVRGHWWWLFAGADVVVDVQANTSPTGRRRAE
jgi:hypothetical protein